MSVRRRKESPDGASLEREGATRRIAKCIVALVQVARLIVQLPGDPAVMKYPNPFVSG